MNVNDLLMEAANCGEFTFLVNSTKLYDIVFNEQVLARDDILSDYTTMASNPFIVVKAKEEAKCMSSTPLQNFVAMLQYFQIIKLRRSWLSHVVNMTRQ